MLLQITISPHAANHGIVRIVYSDIFRHTQGHLGIFSHVQGYCGTLGHIEAYLGIIEAYGAIIRHIRNSAYTNMP